MLTAAGLAFPLCSEGFIHNLQALGDPLDSKGEAMTTDSQDNLPDFSGKVVSFYCANEPAQSAIALDSPTFSTLGGRLYVIGKVAPHPQGHWDDGLESAVAWEQINSYVVFESLDDFRARVASYDAQNKSLERERPKRGGLLSLFHRR